MFCGVVWQPREKAELLNSMYQKAGIESKVVFEGTMIKREEVFRGDLTYKVFDKQAKSKAFWKINQYSGEMYGILPNGTGGGLYQYDSILRQLSTVLEGYSQMIRNIITESVLSGQASFASPVSIVLLFSVTLVRKFAFATEAINIMDAQMIEDDDIKKAFQILACKVALEIPEKLPGGKGVMPGVDRLVGLITNNDLPCQV